MSTKGQPRAEALPISGRAVPVLSGYFPTAHQPTPMSPPVDSDGPDVSSERVQVEIRVVSPKGHLTFPVYEIWTGKTVYALDQSMVCTAVRDASTDVVKEGHACIGARLIGGRRSATHCVDLSSPLPALGHRAMFGDEDHSLVVTSRVKLVVMNVYFSSYLSRTG